MKLPSLLPSLAIHQFETLAEIPPETEWYANKGNALTQRAYKTDIQEFIRFIGIREIGNLRRVSRAHVIAWRDTLKQRDLAPATIRRKLASLSSLYGYLCEKNAVLGNPVDGVERPQARGRKTEGSTPVLGDDQAAKLLAAPATDTLRDVRDRAILATLLYHGLRRAELCALKVKDLQHREGVPHFAVKGKGDKDRYVPVHPAALELISAYVARSGHGKELHGPLFRASKQRKGMAQHLDGSSIYRMVRKYAVLTGIDAESRICVHSTRATAATNALSNDADIAKVQNWLGHADISTTRLYDRRHTRPEESPTFKISY